MFHYKEQSKILEQTQNTVMESMKKYRQLDEEFQEYRVDSERKIISLVKAN